LLIIKINKLSYINIFNLNRTTACLAYPKVNESKYIYYIILYYILCTTGLRAVVNIANRAERKLHEILYNFTNFLSTHRARSIAIFKFLSTHNAAYLVTSPSVYNTTVRRLLTTQHALQTTKTVPTYSSMTSWRRVGHYTKKKAHAEIFHATLVGRWCDSGYCIYTFHCAAFDSSGYAIVCYNFASVALDLLQVSLSLSYSIDPLWCTLHDVARRGGAGKRDLSTSENLGSKLNRKCKTCFNCFLSVFICIDIAQCK
jgi:hypothetical protein